MTVVRETDHIERNSGYRRTFRLWHDLCPMRAIQTTASAFGATLAVSMLAVGCGSGGSLSTEPTSSAYTRHPVARERAASTIARALAIDGARTRPLGLTARFRPPPFGVAVETRLPVDGLRCGTQSDHRYGLHVELFAEGHEIAMPAGIGIAPPQLRLRGSVTAGTCEYPLQTADPTGVVLVSRARTRSGPPTLGELFALWGQPLSRRRLAGFTAKPGDSVAAFVDGRRVEGDPRSVALQPHAQVVLEVGPYVEPHPTYRFAPGV
jgi:hypothetical protein